MSSHHVIRDEQEPPVLVFQLHHNWEELSELLGWSPILLVNPSLKELFDLKQTKIDGYLYETNEAVVVTSVDLVFDIGSLFEAILNWIDNKNYTALNLFCDHKKMLEAFSELSSSDLSIPIIFFTENGKYILKRSSKFRKWYPHDFEIGILNTEIVKLKNLISTDRGFRVEKDGFIEIEVKGNLILVKEGESKE